MSISARQTSCHELIGELSPIIATLSQELAGSVYSEKDTTKFSSGLEHLASLLLFWPTAEQFILKTPARSSEIERIAEVLSGLSTATSSTVHWHAITDQLTEQERAGEVITDLSMAYHALLSGQTPTGFVMSESLLTEDTISKDHYSKSIFHIVAGERRTLSEFVEALITAGYRRHANTEEPGTIVVRGDQVSIAHPSHEGIIRVSFTGSVIESITEHKQQRSRNLTSAAILPVAFPAKKGSWEEITTHAVLAHSGTHHVPAKKTIEYLAPEANFSLPKKLEDQFSQLFTCLIPPTTSSTSPLSYERAMELIGQLEEGKPAVHADHGIGIFEGLQSRNIEEFARDYLVIRYAEGDALSVPIEYAHKITAYIGQSQPIIHRLHGTSWQKTKQKAQHDAAAMAKELLAIASSRAKVIRERYALHTETENILEKTFPFELTEDQKRTWQEVKEDLEKETPMDRLVVGDVGFGKTEIALRAAYHAVQNGRQVALLAPTTLLVQQHYDLFTDRLKHIASDIHLLSRFTSPAQQKEARNAIASGNAKIVIGTHAALSPKIQWQNLGLLIIDEEQRFGVKQKEYLKKMRSMIDVLSLSATPIPRTLSMALSGLRSLSLITTAPQERKAVKTHVGPLTDAKLKEAIEREIKRSGQVYIVAPKIRQLAGIKHDVEKLIPDATIAVAHGRLPDESLAKIIHSFDAGETNILISSSIVEHGLDLPGANTMIVMHAPHFGLSDLYQLRGRIGRRKTQGYAYFFYTQERLTSIQRQRLAAITEASRLGSGWELARRDLEIRGAGNLLGAEQSGSAEAVGVQLYLDMVRNASSSPDTTVTNNADVALPLESVIPANYISDPAERTRWYIRLSRSKTDTDLSTRADELEKEYGPLPLSVQNLLLILRLSQCAGKNTISKISSQTISPPDEDPYQRLIIEAKDSLSVLGKVSALGNWRVRGHALTWDTEIIDSALVQKLLDVLQY